MTTWKTILTFTYPHEAYMAKGYLDSNGIEVILMDEMTAQVNNFYSNAIGGVKLQVKESDFETGLKILEDGGYIDNHNFEKEPDIELVKVDKSTNKYICPFCRSDNIAKKRDPNILVVILYMIIGVIFPIFKAGKQCFDCGKEWKYTS